MTSEETPDRTPGTIIPVPDNFPVEWPDPADAALHWTLDDDQPGPLLHPSSDWPRWGIAHAQRYWLGPFADIRELRIHCYDYSARVPVAADGDELEERAARAADALSHLIDHIESQWERDWYPRIRQSLNAFDAFEPRTASDTELARAIAGAPVPGRELWAVHFELVYGCGYIRRQFDQYCREVFGDATELGTATLTAGDHNWSVAGGEALRELARFVQAWPDLCSAILEPSSEGVYDFRERPGGVEFEQRLDAFVSQFGKKLTAGLTGATWDEDRRLPLENLRALLKMGGDLGAGRRAQVVAAKERLLTEARERLAGLPGVLATEFERLYRSAAFATRLMEDHNYYIDQQSAYYHRRLVIEAARRLHRAGRLRAAADVELLTESELEQALIDLRINPAALVQQRQEEMARWKECSPPRELGTVAPPPPPHPLFGSQAVAEIAPSGDGEPGVLRGLAASRGTVRARVRVVKNLALASALQPGEILVTTITSPSWATWYPILGGLVTESGGILSHAAVVAREYGIPAVVGLKQATAALRTGDVVELDGAAGTIRRLEPS
ncbi:MAG: PEP-utilizing enzyme [Clostridia bacterium]